MDQIDSTSPPGAALQHTTERGHRPSVVLLSASLAVFAVFLDTTIGFVSFPSISATFHRASPSTVSWVLNAYTLVFAALLIPAGRLADRIGRRRMFLTGVVVFTTGSMLCGLAPTVGFLIVAEMLEAVGAALLVPASLALVLQTTPRERVPVAVAIWGAIAAVAGAAGPTLGSLVVSNLGWRWAFFINLPVGIVSLLFGRVVLPEWRELQPGRLPDPWGAVLLAGGAAAITYAIVQTGTWGWASARTVLWALAGLAVLAGFVGRSRRVPNPLVDLTMFRLRDVRWANTAIVAFNIGFNAMFLGNVLFLTRVWHWSILRAGLAISVGPLIVAATAAPFGRLAARVGQRRLLVPGGLLWAVGGLSLVARATRVPDYTGVYLPAIVLTGFGVALCLPQLSSAAVQSLPPHQFGAGSAVVQAVRNVGSTFGVALVVAFTTGTAVAGGLDGFRHVWFLLAGCGVAVSLLSTRLPAGPRRAPAAAGEEPAGVPLVALD